MLCVFFMSIFCLHSINTFYIPQEQQNLCYCDVLISHPIRFKQYPTETLIKWVVTKACPQTSLYSQSSLNRVLKKISTNLQFLMCHPCLPQKKSSDVVNGLALLCSHVVNSRFLLVLKAYLNCLDMFIQMTFRVDLWLVEIWPSLRPTCIFHTQFGQHMLKIQGYYFFFLFFYWKPI